MVLLDVDYPSGVNTLHREDCVHAVPTNNPRKGMEKLGPDGGRFTFNRSGMAVKWLKDNKVKGVITHCRVCAPLATMTPEPSASLGVRTVGTGCDASSLKPVTVTDSKTIYKNVVKKLKGEK